MNLQSLNSIFDSKERELIKTFPDKDRQHPLKRILFPESERDKQVSCNTDIALNHVTNSKYKDWITEVKKRLLDIKDYSNSSSALSEIRAFGDLLSCGVSVKPKPQDRYRRTCDFIITNKGQEIFLEIHAKQINGQEAKNLEAFRKNISNPDSQFFTGGSKITIAEHRTTPFGKPGLGENVTENVISKLIKKNDEGQFSENKPSILWLDFQDESWDLLASLMVEKRFPIISRQGAFFSSDIWYAFYGWKDAPIFEFFDVLNMPLEFVKMRHDGRFRDPNTKIDAAIISFDRDIIILENPFSQKAVDSLLWKQLFCHKWFTFEGSYINWPSNDLLQRIDLEKQRIMDIMKEAET